MNKKITLNVSGMTCGHCEKRVAAAVKKLDGIESVSASFPKKRAEVLFDEDKTSESDIVRVIGQEGYKAAVAKDKAHPVGKVIPIFLIALAVYFIVRYTVGFDFINLIPKIDSTISLIALFVTGLLTSVHCIAMCGGINLSQSVGAGESTKGRLKKPLLYNLGRVISYTLIGGIVGGIGSVLFVSTTVKGIIMLIAAVFMILMSLSMLGWLPWWMVPRLPKKFSARAEKMKKDRGPLIVGLLNGLLPCGPLQAMQLYALSTGSIIMGAMSMLLFSLGTVPLMLGTGIVFSMLKGRFTRSITRVSAVLVMLIAFVMVFNAGGLFGFNPSAVAAAPVSAVSAAVSDDETEAETIAETYDGYAVAQIKDGVQIVETKLEPSKYPAIVVQKGIPVQFHINADASDINGCNATVEFPAYDVEKQLEAGDNLIEFTPNESGTIPYTCWMGMIYGEIKVVDNISASSPPPASGARLAAAAAEEAILPETADAGQAVSLDSVCTMGGPQTVTEEDIAVAQIVDGRQELTVTVSAQGYSPSVLVVQKGIKTKIKFDPVELNYCNSIVVFPDLGSLDLSKGELETPEITPEDDFAFTCGMSMLQGYVKVVDDINNVDLSEILSEMTEYEPQSGSGCCG